MKNVEQVMYWYLGGSRSDGILRLGWYRLRMIQLEPPIVARVKQNLQSKFETIQFPQL